MIVKHEVVLHKHEYQQSENYVYFEAKSDEGERVDGYYMTLDMFEEMGEPEVITVSAVPHDNLNNPHRYTYPSS